MIFGAGTTVRTRVAGVVVLIVTFLVGALGGAAIEEAMDARRDGPGRESRERDSRGDRQARWLDQLELTAQQQAAIDSIFRGRRAQMRAFWEEVEPRFDAIVDSTRGEVRAVLTDEQRAEYDSLRAEHRARYRSGRYRKEEKGR